MMATLATTLASNGLAQPVTGSRTGMEAVPSGDAIDPMALADGGPFSEMSALLEVTIFKIDVLTLTVRVDASTAERLRLLVDGRDYSEELADSVAAAILDAEEAWARQVFHRDVSLDRLASGMRETAEKAAEAGFITLEYFEQFSESVPIWFGFLGESGVKKGDEILFRIQGRSLRTAYRTADGRVLMDQAVAGDEATRASVPSFFAPGTRFRKRLVESLLASRSGA